MSKRHRPSGSASHPAAATTASAAASAESAASAAWPALGALLLVGAACVTLMLSLEYLFDLSLPGCGPGSPCAKAARSPWGKVPGTDWPVAFVGLAYFTAMLTGWLLTRGRPGTVVRMVIRLGAAASAWFVFIIIREQLFCVYCLALHLLNFAFWMTAEFVPRPAAAPASNRPLVAWAGVFGMVTVALALVDVQFRRQADQKAESDFEQSKQHMLAAATRKAASDAPDALPIRSDPTGAPSQPSTAPAAKPFCGRWRWGPEKAPIRIVIYTDFQCVDCNKIEQEMRTLLTMHPAKDSIAVWPKHFPMSSRCNRHMPQDMHPNACWASRAAEAAGILYGNDGFWKMHHWLFDKKGGFTDAELAAGMQQLGFNTHEIERLMQAPETLQRVQEDIEEAVALGLYFTPMIFINGVELKGWNAPNAVTRAVEALLKTNPPAAGPEADRPVPASEKYVADWREGFATPLPADEHPWGFGDPKAPVQIMMWGDYEEPYTTQADAAIRQLISGRNAYYTFRHYPFDQKCNFQVPETKHPNACRMSRAAEAAGLLGGNDAYARMHAWLFEHRTSYSDDAAANFAQSLGLNREVFLGTMDSPDANNAVVEDIQAGQKVGLQSLPWMYVNGKRVPRWQREGDNVLERILKEAGLK